MWFLAQRLSRMADICGWHQYPSLELLTECRSFSPCFPTYFCHTFKRNVKVTNSGTPGIMSDLVHQYVCYEEINAHVRREPGQLSYWRFPHWLRFSTDEAEFLSTNNL